MAKWRNTEEKELPEGSYFDENDLLHSPDGTYLPDGIYLSKDGVRIHYEGIFNTGSFDLVGTK